jgi:glycosyltransferase involved in cell wall biosynthesis
VIMRLAVLASHPIQYYSPLFRELAQRLDLMVFYAHRASAEDQAHAGFGVGFDWDIDLLSGYNHHFLENISATPGLGRFAGYDTPEISRWLKRGSFDAVLLLGWHLKCFWQAIWAAKRAGIPIMVRGDSQLRTPRSTAKRAVKQLIYPGMLRLFDAAFYVGQHSRRYWRSYNYPEGRLFFSPHCVDNEWFKARATPEARARVRSEYGVAPNAKAVLFAGKLVPSKRPLDLLQAAQILAAQKHSVTVLIAGAGPLEKELDAAANAANIGVIQLGFCNQTRMPEIYAAADVLVLPSDGRETWGLVANEALACGTPIVVSDACGCAPDLAEGQAGRSFPVGVIEKLADALKDVLGRPPAATSLADKITCYSLARAAQGVMVGLDRVTRK